MTPLGNADIRAVQRPGIIGVVWLLRLLSAACIAAPVNAVIQGSGITDFQRGDELLFEPGATMLIEVLRTQWKTLGGAARSSAWLTLVFACLGLVWLSVLLVALSHQGRGGPLIARAVQHVPGFTLIGGVTLLAQGGVLAVAALTYAGLGDWSARWLNQPSVDMIWAALGVVALFCVLVLGVIQDLSRAAAVRCFFGPGRALRHGIRHFSQRPGAIAAGWSLRAVGSLGIVLAAAVCVERLHVEQPGSWRILCVFGLHQIAVLALVALRASWLAYTLRQVG